MAGTIGSGARKGGIFAELAAIRARLASRGVDAIDLSIGTPDLPPPAHVMAALSEAALDPANYRYAILDRRELREAASDWYLRRFGIALDPGREVLSLLGSHDGLAHVAWAILKPGDVALVPDPGYPIFAKGPELAGAEVYPMPLAPENAYLADFDSIPSGVANRARLMILSYPGNPIGACAPDSFFREAVRFADRYGIAVLHDNAYSELAFDGRRPGSFLAAPGAKDVGIELNSLSKTYGMSGCRVGFAFGCERILSRLAELKSHIDYGIFPAVQIAAEAALTGPQACVELARGTYEARRDLFVNGLRAIGWAIEPPQATMFCWARIPGGLGGSEAFAAAMAERAGVIVVPGTCFGARGEGYVRVALVQSEERIDRAIRRIAECGILGERA